MSDLRNPVFTGSPSKVQSFVATTVPGVIPSKGARRPHTLNHQEQLEELRRTTLEEAEKMGRERGHAKGFLQGYEHGKELGRKEAKEQADQAYAAAIADFVEALQSIQGDLQKEITAWFEASELKMTDLAMEAVKGVLCSELSMSRDSALEIVKDALRDVTHSRNARIRVNPFDSPLLRDRKQEIISAAGNLRDVEIISDSSIPAGCVIETEGGVVDATTDTKIILLENHLRLAS